MASNNNFGGGQNFTSATNSSVNQFERQRLNNRSSKGIEASFRAQVPEFLRKDPDVVGMVMAINREETNLNRLRKEVEMRGGNK